MIRKFIIVRNNIYGLLFSCIAFIFFLLIFKLRVATDLQAHVIILDEYLKHGYFPTPPLYYFTVYLLGFLFPIHSYTFAALIVLTVFSFLKYHLVFKYFKDDFPVNKLNLSGILSFSLMLSAPIVIPFLNENYLYVGKFSSTIWHNSTTIFVFPFCIWLFTESLKFLKKPHTILFLKLTFISIIIILAKPSFLFAFAIVFPLICLFKFGWKEWFFYSVLLSLLIVICLVIEKNIIYQNNPLDKLVYKGETAKIIIAPFKVWLVFAKSPFVSLITSFLFLISFIILKFNIIKNDLEFLYSLLLFIVSLQIYFMLAESGPRLLHSNFYWQIPISMLIINMVMLKQVFTSYANIDSNRIYWKIITSRDKVIFAIYSLHFISGVYYTLRILIEKNYY